MRDSTGIELKLFGISADSFAGKYLCIHGVSIQNYTVQGEIKFHGVGTVNTPKSTIKYQLI